MYPVPPNTSSFSGIPRFRTSVPHWLWWPLDPQRDAHRHTQDQLPAIVTIVPVVCASVKTHLTNFSEDQHAWLLYPTIGNIQNDICWTPSIPTWSLVGLIPCALKGAKNIEEAWHSAVGTVMSQLRHLDITGPGLKWDCSDGYQWQHYPLLAAWARAYTEQVMVAQVSYGSCPMCEIPKGAPMGIPTVDSLLTQGISIFTWSWWRTMILLLCTL